MRREADAPGRDVELGGVEHEEAGGRGDGEGHRHGAGEGAGGEVGREAQVVAPRGREVGQPRLGPELLRGLLRRHRPPVPAA